MNNTEGMSACARYMHEGNILFNCDYRFVMHITLKLNVPSVSQAKKTLYWFLKGEQKAAVMNMFNGCYCFVFLTNGSFNPPILFSSDMSTFLMLSEASLGIS